MNNLFYIIIAAALTVLPAQAIAQELKSNGYDAGDIVPNGWESIFKTGDLNNDGIADLVLIATPCNSDKMKTRDDGYVYNFNQPILAIYWGDRNGGFNLFKQYDNVVPARPDEFMDITPSIEIDNKGTLRIILEFFASAGSWTQPTTTHVFRYQNGDFYLIGKDVTELERTTGKTVVTSENYLTYRRIVTTERPRRKPSSKKTRLPKNPLKQIGFNLGDDM